MSLPASPSNATRTELEIVVNWRMVAVGGALAALCLIVPVVSFLCLKGGKAEPSAPAVVAPSTRAPVAVPRGESPRFRLDPSAVAAPTSPSRKPPSPPPVQIPELVPPPSPESPRVTAVPQAATVAHAEHTESAPAKPTEKPRPFRSLAPSYNDEFEMLRQLREDVREFDLADMEKQRLVAAAQPSGGTTKDAKKEPINILDLVAKNTEITGLPLRQAKDCTKPKEAAQKMQTVSRKWRRLRVPERLDSGTDPGIDLMNDKTFATMLAKDCTKYDIDELTTLVQMFQMKGYPVRLQLVKLLDACRDARASVLLAERALFDLSEEVRQAAQAALAKRPRTEYRATLLDGFRHPWPPVAHHAAEALAALQDVEAVPKLAALLDEPNPVAPSCDKDGEWTVKELVRINHLRNCVLCHAPSSDVTDPVRGPIPSPGKALPTVYYESIRGPAVRADVTYVRQDFSVLEPVADAAPWPMLQRFDYVVRQRKLTAEQVRDHFSRTPGADAAAYPQRDAVLLALCGLTGEDAGTSSAEWRRLLRKIGLEQ